MLLSCNNKPSQSAAIATDEPEVNEDTLFRVIDLANNLKPCSDSLLLSDIVEDVEYVKLEAADNALVGEMYKGYVDLIFNMQPSDVTAMIIDDIEEAFRICRQTIIKQQLNNQANTILLSLLDELGIKYELSEKKGSLRNG